MTNDNATLEAILQPHIDATRQRIVSHPVLLLVQDTSEIDVTQPEQQVAGVGPLDGGPRRGAFLHPLQAFTPDGTPLGTRHALTWGRNEQVGCASLSRWAGWLLKARYSPMPTTRRHPTRKPPKRHNPYNRYIIRNLLANKKLTPTPRQGASSATHLHVVPDGDQRVAATIHMSQPAAGGCLEPRSEYKMEPISSINSGASTAPQRLQPTNGATAQPTAEAATSVAGATTTKATSTSSAATATASTSTSTSSISLTSSSSTSTINQQVEGFLNSVSPALANNQYLKLLIAALIMQVLLGDESSKQQTGQGGLAMLENLTGSRQNALFMSIESSTNTVQIQNESTRLDVATAVQSISNSQNPTTDTGSQMDISG